MLLNIDIVSYYLFMWVIPIAGLLGWALFVLFLFVLMPEEGRLLMKLRFAKRSSLGLIANDDGILNFELLEDVGIGTFKSKKEKRRYFFLPRPLFKGKSIIDAEKASDIQLANKLPTGEDEEIAAKDRMIIEENLLKRHVLGGVKKPVYIGYTGKLVITGVAALDQVTKSTALERSGEEVGGDAEDVLNVLSLLNKGEDTPKGAKKSKAKEALETYVSVYLNVLDPRVWKQYFKKTSNQAAIDALCYTHEQIGAGDKTPFNWMLIIVIALVAFGGYYALKMLKVI